MGSKVMSGFFSLSAQLYMRCEFLLSLLSHKLLGIISFCEYMQLCCYLQQHINRMFITYRCLRLWS